MVKVGQGILGKFPFKDGDFPAYRRTYIVVFVSDESIGLLNVSSVAGKEHKLLYPTNKHIEKYNPPFWKDCFVKLDSYVLIPVSQFYDYEILGGGACLDCNELQDILSSIIY